MTDVRPYRPPQDPPGDVTSVHSHRASRLLSRRGLLGLAALAAVPTGAVALRSQAGTTAAWCKQSPGVGAVSWFDTDTHPGHPERWRIDTDAQSLAAYRAMARAPTSTADQRTARYCSAAR